MRTPYNHKERIRLADSVNRRHPLHVGRVAWWLTLPELAGGRWAYDLMGLNPAALTAMNNPSSGWRASTRPGGVGSIQTDGGAAYVDMGAVVAGTIAQGTIAAWVYRASTGNIASVGWLDNNAIRFGIEWYTDGNLYGLLGNGLTSTYVTCPLAGVGWHRLLFAFNAAANALYVDGIKQTTSNVAAEFFPVTGTFKIGRDSGNSRFGTQQTDDVSFWSRSLTALEAWEDYSLSRAGYPGLLNRWQPRALDIAPAIVVGVNVSSGGLAISPHGMGIGI